MQVVTPEGYISYPNLITPKKNELSPDRPARYSVDIVFPKGTDLTELQNAMVKIAAKVGIDPKTCHKALKPCSKMIDKDTRQIKPIYDKGDYFLSSWSNESHPPQMVGPQRQVDYGPAKFRAGNLASLIVNIYGGTTPSKYVNAGLLAIQWRGEGDTISPSTNLNMFSDAAVEDIESTEDPAFPETDASNLFG